MANVLHVPATHEGLAEELYPQVDDDRVMSRFVEEVLRLRPPVHGLFRTAMKDVDVGGTMIPAKSQICVMYASANYDESRFPDAGRSEEHTSELQSLMRTPYAVFCLKKHKPQQHK